MRQKGKRPRNMHPRGLFEVADVDLAGEDRVDVNKVVVRDPVGVALSADTDAFQHTVAAKLEGQQPAKCESECSHLFLDQLLLEYAASLLAVRDNATDEMRFSSQQSVHELVELVAMFGGDELEVATLLADG